LVESDPNTGGRRHRVHQGGNLPGIRLAVGDRGVAQALKTVLVEGVTLAESVPTVGIALGAVDEDGLAWVLVNPQ